MGFLFPQLYNFVSLTGRAGGLLSELDVKTAAPIVRLSYNLITPSAFTDKAFFRKKYYFSSSFATLSKPTT